MVPACWPWLQSTARMVSGEGRGSDGDGEGERSVCFFLAGGERQRIDEQKSSAG